MAVAVAAAAPAPVATGVRVLASPLARRIAKDKGLDLSTVGDRVALGISHPCTTFDKWRWLALVEDDMAVTGAISTRF